MHDGALRSIPWEALQGEQAGAPGVAPKRYSVGSIRGSHGTAAPHGAQHISCEQHPNSTTERSRYTSCFTLSKQYHALGIQHVSWFLYLQSNACSSCAAILPPIAALHARKRLQRLLCSDYRTITVTTRTHGTPHGGSQCHCIVLRAPQNSSDGHNVHQSSSRPARLPSPPTPVNTDAALRSACTSATVVGLLLVVHAAGGCSGVATVIVGGVGGVGGVAVHGGRSTRPAARGRHLLDCRLELILLVGQHLHPARAAHCCHRHSTHCILTASMTCEKGTRRAAEALPGPASPPRQQQLAQSGG